MTRALFLTFLIISFLLSGFIATQHNVESASQTSTVKAEHPQIEKRISQIEEALGIPPYSGSPYVKVNNNVPFFHGELPLPDGYEEYSLLDKLGRCGVAEANLSISLMPTEKRGPIGMVKPSGWHTVRYDDIIDKKYLYNRCHLIGFQLAGENANELNLITGTRYLNIDGMLSFENQLAGYVKSTGNHVRYRVTPLFEGDELVARGVLMEAESVEDNGRGVCFNVFCYNVQPGIEIDYLTGDSHVAQ